jgi:hypothetical protein
MAPTSGDVDLEAKLSVEGNRSRIEALNGRLDTIFGQASPEAGSIPKSTGANPESPEVQRLFSQLLTLSCSATRLQLTAPEESKVPRNRMEMIERSLATPTPLPHDFGLKPARYFRLRMLSEDCLRAIERVKNLDPIHAGPACHEWGYYSPQCIEGIRIARMRASGAFKNMGQAAAKPSAAPTSRLAEF